MVIQVICNVTTDYGILLGCTFCYCTVHVSRGITSKQRQRIGEISEVIHEYTLCKCVGWARWELNTLLLLSCTLEITTSYLYRSSYQVTAAHIYWVVFTTHLYAHDPILPFVCLCIMHKDSTLHSQIMSSLLALQTIKLKSFTYAAEYCKQAPSICLHFLLVANYDEG